MRLLERLLRSNPTGPSSHLEKETQGWRWAVDMFSSRQEVLWENELGDIKTFVELETELG